MPCQEDPRLVLKIGTNPSKPLHMALGVCQPPLVLDALLPVCSPIVSNVLLVSGLFGRCARIAGHLSVPIY